MTDSDQKTVLHDYLKIARQALLWKVEGLSEYDLRRPLTATGLNLLGLVKHLAGVEIGYFAETFKRPIDDPPDWLSADAEPNIDMWATADESRDDIIGLYQRAIAHADATIETLALDAVGEVQWWPPERRRVQLQRILVHVIAETNRHCGHADIGRELIDGTTGLRAGNENMAPGDDAWWAAYRSRLEKVAEQAGRDRG